MRINKYLSESGVCSRRAADKLIEDGEVKINGKSAKLGDDVTDDDLVTVGGEVVSAVKKYDYYAMNKPKGYVCTVKDDKGRKTVMDLLPPGIQRVVPVGRLDYDTEGLLLFTNDGELTNKLTHPKNGVYKTYLVKVESYIPDEALKTLSRGVELDGKYTNPCKVKLIERNKLGTKLHVSINEGRNRQVRRMFEAIGFDIDFLKRISIGELTVSGLDRGGVRKLKKKGKTKGRMTVLFCMNFYDNLRFGVILSEFADKTFNYADDRNVIEDHVFHFVVFGMQNDLTVASIKPFYRSGIVDERDYNLPVVGGILFFYYNRIAVENAGVYHTVSRNFKGEFIVRSSEFFGERTVSVQIFDRKNRDARRYSADDGYHFGMGFGTFAERNSSVFSGRLFDQTARFEPF